MAVIKKKTIKSGQLFPWQLDTINLYKDHDKGSIIVVKSPRQRGKTHTLANILLMQCINNKNYTAIVICPAFQICRKQFKEIDKWLKKIPNLVKSSNLSFFEIELTNGSVIKFKSAESKDNLRGDTCDLLIFDEAAFIDLETALECFNYVNVRNGSIILFSTPTFRDENNLFYKYFKEAEDCNPNCYLIDFNDYDTSALLPPDKMELYKRTLPSNIFLNEILGDFLTTSSSLWDIAPVLSNGAVFDNNLCCGIDFATGCNGDETAIAIFNSKRQMCALHHFNDKSATETITFIVNLLKSLPIKKMCVETNSLGSVYKDLLKEEIVKNRLRCQLIEMVTTNASKRDYIEKLQLHIANKTCTLLDNNMLKVQFVQFQMKTTATGLVTYGNSSDKFHDDIVIATALGLHCFDTSRLNIR